MAPNSFDNSYPAFPILVFLSFLLVLIPLPWHLKAWNTGTCLFMTWTAVACLNQFVNSVVWHGNVIDRAPIWCDISTRLSVGVAVALPAASLCINRRLYKIATCQIANITLAHKRRAAIADLAIGLGVPALQMILQFVVQGHRYDIWEDIGCFPTTFNTPLAYPLSFIWPNVISVVSAVYCLLTLRAFTIRRAQFSQFISASSSFSVSQYFRLMGLASCEIIFTIPISSYALYLNLTSSQIFPWKSWSDTHFDWHQIDTFPAALWRSDRAIVASLELNRWTIVLSALVFFGFFGFAEEARRHYRIAYSHIVRRLGFKRHSTQKSSKLEIFVVKYEDKRFELPAYKQDLSPSSITKQHNPFRSVASLESLEAHPSCKSATKQELPLSLQSNQPSNTSFSRTLDRLSISTI